MVFYINKQAVEIKTKFDNAPLTSPNEVCVTIGMLYKIYGLAVPQKRERLKQMKEELHGEIDGRPVPSEFAEKLIQLLDGYYKDGSVTEILYELLKYSYEQQMQ